MQNMELGQIVDFIKEYNHMHKKAEKESNGPTRRKATQADIDRFFGA